MPGKGGNAQTRRRERRALARKQTQTAPTIGHQEIREAAGFEESVEYDLGPLDALAAAASGSTDLPLADRDVAWDAAAAVKTLDAGQFAQAHFWKDPDGEADQIGSFKLPFAKVVDGKLTAIWGGVTGAAAAVQGARGGVKIPDGDVAGVKTKIGSYYEKAESQYKDPSIEPPWESKSDEKDEKETAEADAETLLVDAEKVLPLTPVEVTTSTAAGEMHFHFNFSGLDKVDKYEGATNPDLPAEHEPREQLPGDGDVVQAAPPSMTWTAIVCPEGMPTDDGRIFAPNAVSWRNLPLTLGAMLDTPHADLVTASPVCGRIDEIWRDGNLIRAKGVFDGGTYGQEIARMVGEGTLRGVSVDIAVAKFEIAYRSEILDENGDWKGGDSPSDGDDGPDLVEILFGDTDDELMFVVWDGIIGAVTVCPFPAFSEATIVPAASLTASVKSEMVWTVTQQAGWVVLGPKGETPSSVVAAAVATDDVDVDAPLRPPAGWFGDPDLEELTALVVDDEGRVYGHAAGWETCHIGIPNACTTPPHSATGYAYFHLKEVVCDDGSRFSCGTLTMDTGHADRRLSRVDATRHYDDTGTAVADIVCGEDEHGIWFSGALRPHLDEATIRALRGAAVSGDWRNVNGNLEFIALLTVNVPGFPIPRARALVASGDDGLTVLTLTAAGVHHGEADETRIKLSRDEEAKFEALRELASGQWDGLSST